MDSYRSFASRYDRLIDWKGRRKREEPFFRKMMSRGVRSVLDCHCGTGFHCVVLTELGCYVEGVDVSPDMLAVARENLSARSLDVRLHESDLKTIRPHRLFDCAISMGNSLPHEFGDENLLRSLKGMYDALHKGGLCIIHMENYDALYRDRDRFLPAKFTRTASGGEVFIFAIDYAPDKVVFNILSIIEEGGRKQFNVDVVEYNPVSTEKMIRLLQETGFKAIETYSDFRMTKSGQQDAYDVIFIGTKPV